MLVNLFGEPSVGKSVASAYIFSELKIKGIKCELVTEFAKDLVYENNKRALSNQIYVFGNQFYRIDNAYKQTDVVITDSPLPIASIYGKNEAFSNDMEKVMMDCFNMYDNMNYFLIRNHEFKTDGRIHTEIESEKIKMDIKDLLDRYGILYQEVVSSDFGYKQIINDVLRRFGKNE